ncbi:recombination protein O N-terminal domain-containing protein [Candidatus Peregrinibacteria bacterium]|nr:MAG: recombination protein O N-terminal domain-containing protein [Candidatus Peregrinibacteria bacterium]
MKTQKEKSIILSLRSLSEYDSILTLFGEETGLFRAVVRGIRRPKSRLCGILQPFTEVISEWIPPRSGNGLARYIRAEYVAPPPSSFDPVLLFLSEMVEKGSVEHTPNIHLYEILRGVSLARFPERLVGIFVVQLLTLSGLLPSFALCAHTKEKHCTDGWWREDGAIVSFFPKNEGAIPLAFSEIKTLRYWQDAPLSVSERIALPKESERRILQFLFALLENRHGIRLASKILLNF